MSDLTLKNSSEFSASAVSQAEIDRAMFLGISFSGTQFACGALKYDKLPDAIAYAELVISRGGSQPAVSGPTDWIERPEPTEGDQALMSKHGIAFEQWRYKYQDFRYEKLADAINYATRQKRFAFPFLTAKCSLGRIGYRPLEDPCQLHNAGKALIGQHFFMQTVLDVKRC